MTALRRAVTRRIEVTVTPGPFPGCSIIETPDGEHVLLGERETAALFIFVDTPQQSEVDFEHRSEA